MVAGFEWTDPPDGPYPVQGVLRLADGRIGYYRSRGGHTTIELWPAGTEWPDSLWLPDPPGEEHDLSAFVEGIKDPDYEPETADRIVRRWLEAGAP